MKDQTEKAIGKYNNNVQFDNLASNLWNYH